MRTKVICVLVALALVASAGTNCAQGSLSRDQGLMITRIVMGIAGNSSVRWRDLTDVMKWTTDSGSTYYLRDLATAKTVDSSTVAVLDYTLRLTRSDDNKRYQISLTTTAPKPDDDRLSWFSDDRGVIYTGKPLTAH
jgi:hypothetical protein